MCVSAIHMHTTRTRIQQHRHTFRRTDKGKWTLLFPPEEPWVFALPVLTGLEVDGLAEVRRRADEARLSGGSTCSANCWEDREGQRESGRRVQRGGVGVVV